MENTQVSAPQGPVLPEKRLFIVRRYTPGGEWGAIEKINLEAHFVNLDEGKILSFSDVRVTPNGMMQFQHHIFFEGVIDVEEVVLPTPGTIIH